MIIAPRYRDGVLVVCYIYCNGCQRAHGFPVHLNYYQGSKLYENCHKPLWTFNGDLANPTFEPSMLNFYTRTDTNERVHECHFFLRNGQIQYLSDCKHALAGQTVPLTDFPLETYSLPFSSTP